MNGQCEHQGCRATAEYRVTVAGEESDVCTEHVGAACSQDAVARVYPLGWLANDQAANVVEIRQARPRRGLLQFRLLGRVA